MPWKPTIYFERGYWRVKKDRAYKRMDSDELKRYEKAHEWASRHNHEWFAEVMRMIAAKRKAESREAGFIRRATEEIPE